MHGLPAGGLEVLYAVDHDSQSLTVVAKELALLGVKPVQASVVGLLRGDVDFHGLDFVYAAGLFEYLQEHTAQRLVERMFAMLRPGGRLLLTNLRPTVEDAGYMEAYMDWWLLYRTEDDCWRLTAGLPAKEVAVLSTFCERDSNTTVYLEIQRA